MEVKRTMFWTRVATEDQVVYTYKNGWFTYLVVLPILCILMIIPVIGWFILGLWIFYWYVFPAPGRELRQIMKSNQVSMKGQKFSSTNPYTVTVDRKVFDSVVNSN